jgi:hypothetical protein
MKYLAHFVTLIALSWLGCSSATSSSSTPANASDGGSSSSVDGGATAPSEKLTCAGVIVCATNCPDGDNACQDACLARGSSTAKPSAQAFADCISKNNCADEACVRSKCGPELDACIADTPPVSSPAPAPGGQTPLSGTIVGDWGFVSTAGGVLYSFKPDGTYVRAFRYEATNCLSLSKVEISVSGAAEVAGTTLTLTPKDGTNTSYDCAGTATPKPAKLTPETFQLSFGKNDSGADTLMLTRTDGQVDTYSRK